MGMSLQAGRLRPYFYSKIRDYGRTPEVLFLDSGVRVSQSFFSTRPIRGWSNHDQAQFIKRIGIDNVGANLTAGTGVALGFITPKCPDAIGDALISFASDPDSEAVLDSISMGGEVIILPRASRVLPGDWLILLRNNELRSVRAENFTYSWGPSTYYVMANAFQEKDEPLMALQMSTRAVRSIQDEVNGSPTIPVDGSLAALIYAFNAGLFYEQAQNVDDALAREVLTRSALTNAIHALDYNRHCDQARILYDKIVGPARKGLDEILTPYS